MGSERSQLYDAGGNPLPPRDQRRRRFHKWLHSLRVWIGSSALFLFVLGVVLTECGRHQDRTDFSAWKSEQRRSLSELAKLSQTSIDSLVGIDEADVSQLIEVAKKITEGEVADANVALDQLKTKYADLAVIYFLDGNIKLQSQALFPAIRAYDTALTIRVNFPEAWVNQAIAYEFLGEPEIALSNCDSALSYRRDFALAWNERGNALNNLARYTDAVASFDSALTYGSHHAHIWSNRGIALSNLGHVESALASYDSALVRDTRLSKAWFNRGVDLMTIGRLFLARTCFDSVLTFERNDPEAWLNRGGTYHLAGQHALALADYDSALVYMPRFSEALANRASALIQLDRPKEALASIDSSIAYAPSASAFRAFLIRKRAEIKRRVP